MKKHSHSTIAADSLITLGILAFASLICFFLQRFSSTDTHVPLLFVLAVMCISRFTHGYVYGIAASLVAVVGVNYVFAFPYFELNFSLTGYPLTFLAMLAVSVMVCAMTGQIKAQEAVRLEIATEKMRSNLLRAVSHDIRTPLTSIVGSASAILENEAVLDNAQKIALIEDIRKEAEWLNRVVENILSITRINSAGAEITKNPELAEEIASSAVCKFEKRYPGVRVDVHVPDEALLVPMDATLIEQVLVNLLENAVLHGKITTLIEVRIFRRGARAVFEVADNGIGIASEILPHLFDGSLPIGEKDSGVGRNMKIGLSICQSIIRAHQGSLHAENPESGGAKFWFDLPMTEE